MYLILLSLFSISSYGWDLVAHRGVHHTYGDKIKNGCRKLVNQRHTFIENTVPSINKAFDYGADRVEIDLVASKDGKVFLFHDERLDCLGINAKVIELSWEEIQKIDPGAAVTFDGTYYPFKNSGLRFSLLTDILKEFPLRKFLINPKNDDSHLISSIIKTLSSVPSEIRKNFWVWGKPNAYEKIHYAYPEVKVYIEGPTQYQKCLDDYFSIGWLTYPDSCKNRHISIGSEQWWMIWDWPFPFLNKAFQEGTRVSLYLANSTHEVSTYENWPLESVIISNIDLLRTYHE